MKRIILMLTVAAFMVAALSVTAAASFAAQALPPGCEKVKGQVVCTTTENSKKNDKFSTTTTTTTQGNTTNFSPEPQGTGTESGCSDSNPGNSCPPGQGVG
jgi:hypothetical protein